MRRRRPFHERASFFNGLGYAAHERLPHGRLACDASATGWGGGDGGARRALGGGGDDANATAAAAPATPEVVYWRDVPGDHVHRTSYPDGGGGGDGDGAAEEKYITFEPDQGGWNNMRMALECILVLAHATGRTLVMPPPYQMYLLPHGRMAFEDIFPFERLREQAGVKVIPMAEVARAPPPPSLLVGACRRCVRWCQRTVVMPWESGGARAPSSPPCQMRRGAATQRGVAARRKTIGAHSWDLRVRCCGTRAPGGLVSRRPPIVARHRRARPTSQK